MPRRLRTPKLHKATDPDSLDKLTWAELGALASAGVISWKDVSDTTKRHLLARPGAAERLARWESLPLLNEELLSEEDGADD